MSDLRKALESLSAYRETTPKQRLEIASSVAHELGDDWKARSALAGDDGLPLVYSEACRTEFVVVPGGELEMGFTLADEAALQGKPGMNDRFAEGFLKKLSEVARPTARRLLRPFLFSRDHLSKARLQLLDPGVVTDEFTRTSACAFVEGTAYRLPSEAEYEWVCRAGGTDHFVCDLGSRHEPGRSYPVRDLENRWGVMGLLQGEWVADDWHQGYEDAPETGEPWLGGDTVGVFRGGLGGYVEGDRSLLYALCAHRGRGDYAEGLIMMRLAFTF